MSAMSELHAELLSPGVDPETVNLDSPGEWCPITRGFLTGGQIIPARKLAAGDTYRWLTYSDIHAVTVEHYFYGGSWGVCVTDDAGTHHRYGTETLVEVTT